MSYDAHVNLCASVLTNSPGTGGTSFAVTATTGASFPATPFNCTVWTANTVPVKTSAMLAVPNSALAEVVRVTGIAGDTLTVTRAQEGTTAQNWTAGAVIGNTITALDITAIEANALGGTVNTTGAPVTSGDVALFNDTTGKVLKDGGALGSAAFTASSAYDPAGAAAAVTPTTLGLVIGTNVQAYNAATVTGPGSSTAGHIAKFADTSGHVLSDGGAAGSGTVTSVTFTGDGTVLSNTPSGAVTTTGTVTASLNTQTANTVLAGPTTGSASTPTFRALVTADIPYASITGDTVISAAGVSSTNQLHAAAMYSGNSDTSLFTQSGASSVGLLPSGTLFVKGVPIGTNASTDLVTITLPAAYARWVVKGTRSDAGNYCVASQAGSSNSLSTATIALFTAASGGGNNLTGTSGAFANITGANKFQHLGSTYYPGVQTVTTIVIRQIAASANTGTVDLYIPLLKLQ